MLFDRFKQVAAFVFAFHGVCTDGRVCIGTGGSPTYVLHMRDLYALRKASRHYPVAIIGERIDPEVVRWMTDQGIAGLSVLDHTDSSALCDWIAVNHLHTGELLCMGSDDSDLSLLGRVDFGACTADAVEDIKAAATYISPKNGGAGAVRDVIEKVMRLQGVWGR